MSHKISEQGGFTLGTLIEALNDLVIDGVDPDTPVHYAWQPQWPLHVRTGVVVAITSEDEADAVVYLGADPEASHDYLDDAGSDALGWD